MSSLIALSSRSDLSSCIVLTLAVSICLLYLERKRILLRSRYCLAAIAPLLVIGVMLYYFGKHWNSLVVMLTLTTLWSIGFVLCYGVQSAWAAKFPLFFAILMVTVPFILYEKIVYALQAGSAAVTYALFKLLGVPVLWQHYTFSLPGVDIAITKDCSGIRSSLVLFITSILVGRVFLQSNWRKVFFSVFTLPVVIFKNAVRIVTLSCLGVYLDPGFLHGRLHRYGGLPFSLVSLAILLPVLVALHRGESSSNERAGKGSGPGKGHDLTPLTSPAESIREPVDLICKNDSIESRFEGIGLTDSSRKEKQCKQQLCK